MASSMSINGETIVSNKPGGISITGGTVVFGDGSSYNTATGKFVNCGKGDVYVNGRLLGSDPQDASTPRDNVSPENGNRVFDRFDATSLVLHAQSANFTVKPHDGTGMLVTLAGDQEAIDAFKVGVEGDGLRITEPAAKSGTSRYMTSHGGLVAGVITGSVVVNSFATSGDIVLGGVSIGKPVQVTVQVPVGTAITVVARGTGDVTIGDVRGPLEMNLHGTGDLTAGQVAQRLKVMLSGVGDVRVTHIQADIASIDASGTGDVTIGDGAVDSLEVSATGIGDVSFGGTANSAKLHATGVGDITVAHCLTVPTKRKNGLGDITVRRVG